MTGDKSTDGTDQQSPIPWEKLSEDKRQRFAKYLNQRFDVSLSLDEAEEYYGNPEKVREELGEMGQGPTCPRCFGELYQKHIPYIKQTGRCPHCGEVLSK